MFTTLIDLNKHPGPLLSKTFPLNDAIPSDGCVSGYLHGIRRTRNVKPGDELKLAVVDLAPFEPPESGSYGLFSGKIHDVNKKYDEEPPADMVCSQ